MNAHVTAPERRYTVALFVPGDRPERYEKAAASGADVVIVDLEDAVALERKQKARECLREALSLGLRAFVRINSPATVEGTRDLATLAGSRPAGLVVAKSAGSADIATVRERFPGLPLIALIESIAGIEHLREIAESDGVEVLAFGAHDLCAELGARATPDVLAAWRSRIVFAARAAGRGVLDAPYLFLLDDAGLAADARRAVEFGFDGKLAVHPKQVLPIRAAFTPLPEELRSARAIVQKATAGGVAVHEGTMIDRPMLLAAERLLARE